MTSYTLEFRNGRGWVNEPVVTNRGPSVTSSILEAFGAQEDNFWLPETFWQEEIPEVKSKYPTYAAECDLADCTICQKPIKKGEKITRLPCKNEVSHAFHKDCISPWLQNNNTCPNCRSEV
tara:strand:- start:8182 stop:8544 length:363 start_codon:yes stop_codon:yes gene_type:complete